MPLMSNMDDERKEYGSKLANRFHPIDFSSIRGFLNDDFDPSDVFEYTQDFHENDDSTILHITFVIDVLLKVDIYHEDRMMEIFAYTLDGDAYEWFFEELPSGSITSLLHFFEIFLKRWY